MYDVNVLGTLHVTQALLPALRASGDGLVVNVGSTAGRVAYEGGGGYTAAKHGTQVLTETLRLELVRRADPDLRDRARAWCGPTSSPRSASTATRRRRTRSTPASPTRWSPRTSPTPSRWIATRPSHVNIDELVIRPRAQAAQHKVHRVE